MAYIPDIQESPPADSVPRSIKQYTAFLGAFRDKLASNAVAYVNQRAMHDKDKSQQVKKVLKAASFVPANPTRFEAGSFYIENMKYFVIHRPSFVPTASTLLAIVREFSESNRVAASHFVIGTNGELIQMVDLADKAPHCGASHPANNANSAGVELEGAIGSPITEAQYQKLAWLLRTLDKISGFLPSMTDPDFAAKARLKILGHSEIRPGDKADPGPNFNYNYLISLLPRVQVSGDYYQLPFDPREKIAENLDAILKESFGAAQAGTAARYSAMVQDAAAVYRAASLTDVSRADLSAWAAQMSQKMSTALSAKLQAHMEAQARADLPRTELNPDHFPPRFNFSTGRWEA